MRRLAVLVVAWFGAVFVATALDGPGLERRFAELQRELAGAPYPVKQRLLTELRDELFMQPVELEATVWTISSFNLDPDEGGRLDRQSVILSWALAGLEVPPVGQEERPPEEVRRWAASTLRASLPDGDKAALIVLRQGGLTVSVLTQDENLFTELGRGGRVHATVRVSGLFQSSFYGFLVDARSIED